MHIPPIPHKWDLTNVVDNNVVAVQARLSLDAAAAAGSRHIDQLRTAGTDLAVVGVRDRIGESDAAEVDEGDEGGALLEVLDDPLGVGLAEVALGTLVGERVGHGLTGGEVLDVSLGEYEYMHNTDGSERISLTDTAGGAVCGHGDEDVVACGEANAAEVVGVVGVPLVPSTVPASACMIDSGTKDNSLVGDLAVLNGEVDAGLENGRLACVTINTDPGGGSVSSAAITTAGSLRVGHGEGAVDASVAGADEDGAGPVLRVLHGGGGGLAIIAGGLGSRDHGVGLAGASSAALLVACAACLGAWGGEGGGGGHEAEEHGGGLHGEGVV